MNGATEQMFTITVTYAEMLVLARNLEEMVPTLVRHDQHDDAIYSLKRAATLRAMVKA